MNQLPDINMSPDIFVRLERTRLERFLNKILRWKSI